MLKTAQKFVSLNKSKSFQYAIFNKSFATSRYLRSAQQASEVTTLDLNPTTLIATLTLNRMPANAMNIELLQQIAGTVKQLEETKCRGIIVTSASSRIYSAGLDLTEVYKPELQRLSELWQSLQHMWLAVFSTRLPTAALINGHALAGGCVLAMSCDYRVMLPKFVIGLNETKAGIAVPKWVMDSYLNALPNRRIAEADLIEGRVYDSNGAYAVGLVDELVDTKEQGVERCVRYLKSLGGANHEAVARTKQQFRAEIIKDFHLQRQRDLEQFLQGAQRSEVQEFLGKYLQALKNKTVSNKQV